MCAGGTDCGANVWILEMWPGKDAWLQSLHFTFAIGCALGPLIVEPFLSVEVKENEMDKIVGKTSGTASINDQNNESRIHVPYAVSGLASVIASISILYLYILQEREKRRLAHLKSKQLTAAGENILLTSIKHPAAMEAGCDDGTARACCHHELEPLQEVGEEQQQQHQDREENDEQELELELKQVSIVGGDRQGQDIKKVDENILTKSAVFLPKIKQQTQEPPPNSSSTSVVVLADSGQQPSAVSISTNHVAANEKDRQQLQPLLPISTTTTDNQKVKITSKAKEQSVGRPPYYVMFAIALSAMCLSFYCGIEITSMNYLATFAVNIDLQLNKSTAALMSSALTISFAVGRAFGIWIAAYMKPHKLFYLCASIMATGNVFMLIFANTAETLLWYSICLFGIGCGPMFPAIVSFYDDRISKVTNTVSGIFILGSMFNVALNSLIIGHHIIDNALILIVCNLVGSVILLLLFGTLHMLTKVKKNQRVKKFRLKQQAGEAAKINSTPPPPPLETPAAAIAVGTSAPEVASSLPPSPPPQSPETAPTPQPQQQQQSSTSPEHDNNNNKNNDTSSNVGNEEDDQNHQHHHQQHGTTTTAAAATTTAT